jgi:hypothetical protein
MDTPDTESTKKHEGEERGAGGKLVPDVIHDAAEGKVSEPGVEEVDATEWLLSSADEDPEIEPETIWITHKGKRIKWQVVPLPGDEFKKFRAMATGNRAAKRAQSAGQMAGAFDENKYNLLIVTAATVFPDIRDAAKKLGVADPAEVVQRRFIDKPGWIAQIAGVVSDASGYDESEIEVAAGNS